SAEDLTFDPATGHFYTLDTNFHILYDLGPGPGQGIQLVPNLSYNTAALAVGPDGLLNLLAADGGGFHLVVIDPVDGSIRSSDPVSGTTGAASAATVGGMTLRPGTGTFLVTAEAGETDLYELDPVTRVITLLTEPAGSVEGGLSGL